jgi:hypothetical protein
MLGPALMVFMVERLEVVVFVEDMDSAKVYMMWYVKQGCWGKIVS